MCCAQCMTGHGYLLITCRSCWSHKQFALPTTNMAFTNISFLVILVVFATVCIEHSRAGYCSKSYTCYDKCYKRQCSGWWTRKRCSHVSFSCSKTCSKQVCCSGYTNPNCAKDIDECALNLDHCKQNCINTKGSYKCSCKPGFILQPDGCTCVGHWCEETRACKQTCSKLHSSGGSWWRRTTYSASYYTCYKSCRFRVCCPGWRGPECSILVGK